MAPKLKLSVRPRGTTSSMASASTPEDTIRVQQRLADVEIPDNDDDVTLDQEDDVEEYDFSNEAEENEDDYEDDGLDTAHLKYPNGTLTISSDDEDDGKQVQHWEQPDRPWRAKDFEISTRHAYETMFFEIPDRPMTDISGVHDWDITEEYMRERDHEMLRYIEDYPLPQWVIAPAKAQDAYSRLLERVRWRSLGIRIYRSNNMPIGTQPFQSVSQMQPRMASGRHPSQSMPNHRSVGSPNGIQPHHAQPDPLPHPGRTHGSPAHTPNGMMPAPSAVLRSQPDAQPMQPGPNGIPVPSSATPAGSGSAGSPSTSVPMSYHGPTYAAHAHTPSNASGNRGKSRDKKADTPPLDGAASKIPTPPYESRPKPPDRRVITNPRRKNHIKSRAESDIFPWNRKIDFKVAKVNAVWDDNIYSQARLADMEATRLRNARIIERIDGEETERQRLSRIAKKNNADASSDVEKPKRPDRRRISAPKAKAGESSTSEQHSGSYNFASAEDAQKARTLSKNTADEILLAYEDGEISLDACSDIMICWNAGKKSSMEELEHVCFSVRDSILTREQVDSMPVLTHKSAERIVDFCPDLVWRDMLLRIASEAGYGNKEIRDRLCHNGSYVDKATITKRIGAALGQKQLQTAVKNRMKQVNESSDPADIKTKEHLDEEQRFYDSNVADFSNYMEFFGHRTSHRNQLKMEGPGRKRKLGSGDREESSGMEEIASSPRKRKRAEKESVQSPLAMTSSDEMTGVEEESGAESEMPADAVSVQSDTMLDEMDED